MPIVPGRHLVPPGPDTEYPVMAGRLPPRSVARIRWFVGLTVSIARQRERTDGLVRYSFLARPPAKTFWTLPAWTDDDALSAFVRELPHRAVMVGLRPHMGATRFVTWWTPGSRLPASWDDAIARLTGPTASAPHRP